MNASKKKLSICLRAWGDREVYAIFRLRRKDTGDYASANGICGWHPISFFPRFTRLYFKSVFFWNAYFFNIFI